MSLSKNRRFVTLSADRSVTRKVQRILFSYLFFNVICKMSRKNLKSASKLQGSIQEVQGPATTINNNAIEKTGRTFKVTKQVSSTSNIPGLDFNHCVVVTSTLSTVTFPFLVELAKLSSVTGSATVYQQSLHLKKVGTSHLLS
jgi:hypothetical protein